MGAWLHAACAQKALGEQQKGGAVLHLEDFVRHGLHGGPALRLPHSVLELQELGQQPHPAHTAWHSAASDDRRQLEGRTFQSLQYASSLRAEIPSPSWLIATGALQVMRSSLLLAVVGAGALAVTEASPRSYACRKQIHNEHGQCSLLSICYRAAAASALAGLRCTQHALDLNAKGTTCTGKHLGRPAGEG